MFFAGRLARADRVIPTVQAAPACSDGDSDPATRRAERPSTGFRCSRVWKARPPVVRCAPPLRLPVCCAAPLRDAWPRRAWFSSDREMGKRRVVAAAVGALADKRGQGHRTTLREFTPGDWRATLWLPAGPAAPQCGTRLRRVNRCNRVHQRRSSRRHSEMSFRVRPGAVRCGPEPALSRFTFGPCPVERRPPAGAVMGRGPAGLL